MYALTFMLAAGVSGLGGALLGMVFSFTPSSGVEFLLTGFTVVVLGGLGSVIGTLVGGLALGLVESLAAAFLGDGYRLFVGLVAFLVFLALRPQGLFGRARMKRPSAQPGMQRGRVPLPALHCSRGWCCWPRCPTCSAPTGSSSAFARCSCSRWRWPGICSPATPGRCRSATAPSSASAPTPSRCWATHRRAAAAAAARLPAPSPRCSPRS